MDANLLPILGYAFVGGLILNVMPCVLPVLTFKVMHVVEQAHADPKHTRLHGLAYAAGIIATMLGLAVFVVGLKASSEFVGWGMQFQNPAFVATITTMVFVFGLNAVGVFELPMWLSGQGNQGGYMGSFVNGVFASVMSTPCSAPALGSAAAFALDKSVPAWATLLVFAVIGLGLAFPFLLVSFFPRSARFLPKPGNWMVYVRQLMGFTLFAATVWLYGALRNQISPDAAQDFLYFLLFLTVAVWGAYRFAHAGRPRLAKAAFAVLLAGAVPWWNLEVPPPPQVEIATIERTSASPAELPPVVKDGKIAWADFSSALVDSSLAMQRPVFMDYTADWCLNCKANEKAFIETERIREVLTETRILPMKADMTNSQPEIEKWLAKLGRNGIPAYVVYTPDGGYDLLPEVITTEMLAERLEAASKVWPPDGFKRPAG